MSATTSSYWFRHLVRTVMLNMCHGRALETWRDYNRAYQICTMYIHANRLQIEPPWLVNKIINNVAWYGERKECRKSMLKLYRTCTGQARRK